MSTEVDKQKYFQQVYDQVFPLLVRIVYRITGSVDSAEEICQDAFIKYYERMDQIEGVDGAKYWLIRVAKNMALNVVKRKGREKLAYDKVLQQPTRPQETGETKVLKKEAWETVREALDQLPPNLKEVLVLKEYSDMNYKEIGKVVGISEGNVKIRVFRAREKLKQLIEAGGVYVP